MILNVVTSGEKNKFINCFISVLFPSFTKTYTDTQLEVIKEFI